MLNFPEYETLDAIGLAELVRSRQVAPAELIECAIARIEERDPRINAVVIRAFDQARLKAQQGAPDGPFCGVPFLIKNADSFYCAGVPLTQGSRALAGYIPDFDSLLMQRYHQAGLIVVGATNTPEFSLSAVTEPELYGPTENPWRHGITCGGSSGGSAAAVAARMVPLAGGSDIAGSIRIPAGCCGVFGFKPTHRRTPVGDYLFGDVDFLCAHVITRSVRDSAAALDAAGGFYASPHPKPPTPARPFLEEVTVPVEKLRIAYSVQPPLPGDVHPDCVTAVHDAAKLLAGLGHHVEEVALPVNQSKFAHDWLVANGMLTAQVMDRLPRFAGRAVNNEDLEQATVIMKIFGDYCRGDIAEKAFAGIKALGDSIASFFLKYDVVLTPTISRPPVMHHLFKPKGVAAMITRLMAGGKLGFLMKPPRAIGNIIRDAQFRFYTFTPLGSALGLPSVNVPLHWTAEGLPIGTLFTAAHGNDALLFRLSAQLEKARPWNDRRPPTLE